MNEQWTPRISYDFQAPLGDFGQVRESYKRLKLIHYMLLDLNDRICKMKTVIPDGGEKIEPDDTKTLRYAVRSDGKSGFLFINNYQDHIEQTDKANVRFNIKTGSETLMIPLHGELNIKKNVSCVLPFHINLSGIPLYMR